MSEGTESLSETYLSGNENEKERPLSSFDKNSSLLNPTLSPARVRLSYDKKQKFVTLHQFTLQELSQFARSKYPPLINISLLDFQIKNSFTNQKYFLQTDYQVRNLKSDDLIKISTSEGVPSKNLPSIQWFWFDEDGKWKPFNDGENRMLEQAYSQKRKSIKLSNDNTYATISNRNLWKTQKKYPIIRGSWFWETESGVSVPFEEQISKQLEAAYQKLFRANFPLQSIYIFTGGSRYCEVTKTQTLQYQKEANQLLSQAVLNKKFIRLVTRGWKGETIPTAGFKLQKVWESPTSSSPIDFFSSLPKVIISHIMTYLSLTDALSLSLVGKIYSKALTDDFIWETFCRKYCGIRSRIKWNNRPWKEIFKNQREGVWESTYQYSNCVSFQDGNTAVTSTQSSSPPIVVRGSPCLRRKGQFLFELHIKNKTGDIGIGIVNKYFDFNTNRFSNSLKGKSWVYWSSGFIRDVADSNLALNYSASTYDIGDNIIVDIDFTKKSLTFLKNSKEMFVFKTLNNRYYWLIVCFKNKDCKVTLI